MLGIIGENARNERAHRLLSRFLDVMSDITNNIDPQEISAPIQRGLSALRKLSSAGGRGSEVVESIGKYDRTSFLATANDLIASVLTPSDSSGPTEEHSPYSVLNAILWGNAPAFVN